MRIDGGEILAGEFPREQAPLVLAWIRFHRDEPLADWALAPRPGRPRTRSSRYEITMCGMYGRTCRG